MKSLFIFCIIISGLLLPRRVWAQEVIELTEVELTGVQLGTQSLTAEKNGDEFEFILTAATEVKTKKGKKMNLDILQKGMKADVKYTLNDTAYIATRITLMDGDQRIGGMTFDGYFDYQKDSMAFVGGKRVVLPPGKLIYGNDSKACNCKGYVFRSFLQKPLSFGYSLNIKGVLRADGSFLAEKITACKNTLSEPIAKAIEAVGDKFEESNLTFKRISGTYQGSIIAGGVEYKLHKSEDVQEYVVGVGTKVLPRYLRDAEKEETASFKYRFFVIDNETPDAFSWPNGMVFINTGLLRNLGNEAQLAYILARELAHINYFHTAKRVQKTEGKNKAIGFFKTIAAKTPELIDKFKSKKDSTEVKTGLSKDISRYADDASALLNDEKNKKIVDAFFLVKDKIRPVELIGQYTKAQEAEADEVALSYLYIAGYDVREAIKFWESLSLKMKKPGFMSAIAKGYKKLIPKDLVNALSGDIKTSLAEKGTDVLFNKVFESVYTAPGLVQNRLNVTTQIVQNNYPKEDFTEMITTTKEFAYCIKLLK
jgi:hypothetical protein